MTLLLNQSNKNYNHFEHTFLSLFLIHIYCIQFSFVASIVAICEVMDSVYNLPWKLLHNLNKFPDVPIFCMLIIVKLLELFPIIN